MEPIRILTEMETDKLLSIPNKRYPTATRNYCMMGLQLFCGLRASELIGKDENQVGNKIVGGLRIGDLVSFTDDNGQQALEIRIKNGKGGKSRTVYLQNREVIKALERWEKMRPVSDTDLLFVTLKGGKVKNRYYRAVIKRYCKRAGINNGTSTHTLRHTFATRFLKRSKNLKALQDILGHSNISTTTIYTHLTTEDIKQAMLA